ncbi:TPA: hypothetical protein PXL93_001583 [Yersinia enterocolitica]|nr:hypothetical protein [Yersinia enterocolitica]HDL6899015.1 hypothetical protein [Yersinia enterocolitica]HDL7012374.1 hypothetical protein [Yersinia enterocolitica]HDL7479312.1 hypothetical protein [Yersinia enterocolitica]
MTTEELLALTPEQVKAWKRFKAAVKDFKKAGGEFYTVLDSVRAYNGKYVEQITGDESESPHETSDAGMDSISNPGLSGFADDTHYIHLTDKGRKLVEGNADAE